LQYQNLDSAQRVGMALPAPGCGFGFALTYFLPELSNREETGALVFTLGYDFDL